MLYLKHRSELFQSPDLVRLLPKSVSILVQVFPKFVICDKLFVGIQSTLFPDHVASFMVGKHMLIYARPKRGDMSWERGWSFNFYFKK